MSLKRVPSHSKLGLAFLLAGGALLAFAGERAVGPAPAFADSVAAANSFQKKLMILSEMREQSSGMLNPVVFTDDEVNSYLKYDRPHFLPPSVKDLEIHFKPDGIHGAANVNFNDLQPPQQLGDQLGAKLLASIFQGTQRVTALGKLQTGGGTGTLTIQDVHIGSTTLSDWLVNWLLHTYIQSEYKVDPNKPFLLPDHVTRIDFAPGKAIFVRAAQETSQ